MSKKTYVLVMAFALATVLVTGGLMAGNMGFKLAQTFNSFEDGVWASGESHFAVAFYPHLGLSNAATLKSDIEAHVDCAGHVGFVQRFNQVDDQRESWFGAKIGGTNFDIQPCQAYFVTINTDGGAPVACPYLNAGTHNPVQDCTFVGRTDPYVEGVDPKVGESTYSLPFHTINLNAADLLNENFEANFVQRYDQVLDQRQSWFGAKIGGTNFPITPGEGYFITMPLNGTQTFKPAHY